MQEERYFENNDQELMKFLGKCPTCSSRFEKETAEVIGRKGELSLIHVDCKECLSSVILAVVSARNGMITTIGIMTDLFKDDVKNLRNTKSISPDEVIEFHQYLKKHSKNAP